MAGKLSKLGWYWHRLRAMSPGEVALRFQKKGYQKSDASYRNDYSLALEPAIAFPKLPEKSEAPAELLEGLRRDVPAIQRGDWKAFGHFPLQVDRPPKWQFDYFARLDFQTSKSAFKLDHRAQPGGADIKVIWEPNRWYQLVRLALGGWLLEDQRARETCIAWLADWARLNPPFTGLNWTSGLETGIRLIQFTWIDRFLEAAGVPNNTLAELRRQILPPHVHYTWRYKSFGSSANNHLIGELAGLIVAIARWPELATISAPLAEIGALMEREILAQFAADGGNEEQALGYHLFSWEFCWQSIRALEAAGVAVRKECKERLLLAGEFYRRTKPAGDPWDFGDSDNAWVTPLFADETESAREWWNWFHDSKSSPALRYWWGDFGRPHNSTAEKSGMWMLFEQSGYAVFRSDDWFLRLDFSPLGYLSMAPHGHLDALHLSAWHRGKPVIIDPGTGSYHAEKRVRNYFADWASHNGPQPHSPRTDFPRRFGTFLWGSHHRRPACSRPDPLTIRAEIALPYGTASRVVTFLPDSNSVRIQDQFSPTGNGTIVTRWKFAPEIDLGKSSGNEVTAKSSSESVRITPGASWRISKLHNPDAATRMKAYTLAALGDVPLETVVSPAFRLLTVAPYLELHANGQGPHELILSPG